MNKIAVDARMISSSGIGTVIQNVLQRLISRRPDWTFYVISTPDSYDRFDYLQNDNVAFIPSEAPIYSIREQLEIPRLVPGEADLLWVPHYNVPLLYHGAMVVTIHDVFHLAMPEFVKGIHKRLYAKWMFAAASRKAAHIICVSQFTVQELEKYVHTVPSKISVICNGVDSFWGAETKVIRPLYPKPYILYVGNVKPHKNVRRLVQAFQRVAGQIDCDLVIVGKKEGFITGDPVVAKLAGQMPERIHFTGYVSDEDLRNYYRHAALFVFPSLYEGFGLPPLEAAAAGCRKILCSKIPALEEIYGNSVAYFDPYNEKELAAKIVSMLDKKSSLEILDVSRYDWKRCAAGYEEVFSRFLTS